MLHVGAQNGFTLVEMAIVIVISGLLIATALQAQTLVLDARVVSTVSQIQSYSTAVSTFKSIYTFLPGDMPNAGVRLPGCPGVNGAACTPLNCAVTCDGYGASFTGTPPGAGDAMIGQPLWSTAWSAPNIITTSGAAAPTNVDAERYLFWSHLQLAGLITGLSANPGQVLTFQNGLTNPSVASGGGLIAGYGTGLPGPGSLQPAGTGLSGLIFVQAVDPTKALPATTGTLPLTPQVAAMIDRKVDDGLPGAGYVQAYGVGASCFTSAGTLVYNESMPQKDCGLIYRVGN